MKAKTRVKKGDALLFDFILFYFSFPDETTPCNTHAFVGVVDS